MLKDRVTNDFAKNWKQYNKIHLFSELENIREAMFNLSHMQRPINDDWPNKYANKQTLENELPTALDIICKAFALSAFERKLLLLCAGVELDSEFALLCTKAQNKTQCSYPTLGLAFSLFDDASWDKLMPQSPLRYWQLIELDSNVSLSLAPLKISERIAHYLLGNNSIDKKLTTILKPLPVINTITPSQEKIVKTVIDLWSKPTIDHKMPLINLVGRDTESKQAIAKAVCQQIGLTLYAVRNEMLFDDFETLENLCCLLEREAVLNNMAYLLEYDVNNVEQKYKPSTINLLTQLSTKSFVLTQDNLPLNGCSIVSLIVDKPSKEEQQQLWQNTIVKFKNANLNQQQIANLVGQFDLNVAQIHSICTELNDSKEKEEECDLSYQNIWQACRKKLRSSVKNLVQVITPKAQWQDLVLPDQQRQLLKKITSHVMQRYQVYQRWGFAKKSTRGWGISALFSGPSGAGKTLAAEVLANELQLDLYYIDLSSVINKYIGETEKNIKKIFDIAQDSGAILLFDEADALFGKRSEVKDSHDRYANIETSYLLQRIESYSGLSILTTNIKENIDHAFIRRIRFIVEFPFPEQSERVEIWKHILPEQLPTENLEFNKLSQLNLSGGNIYNVALNAAFIAANDQSELTMKHLYQAAQDEYLKLEKALPGNKQRRDMMSMDKINFVIDELVLKGLANDEAKIVSEAINSELQNLLQTRALSREFIDSQDAITLSPITLNTIQQPSPNVIGEQIAQSIYQGLVK